MSILSLNFFENSKINQRLENSIILKKLLIGLIVLSPILIQISTAYFQWEQKQLGQESLLLTQQGFLPYAQRVYSMFLCVVSIFITILISDFVTRREVSFINFVMDAAFALIFGLSAFVVFSYYNIINIDTDFSLYFSGLCGVSITINAVIFEVMRE